MTESRMSMTPTSGIGEAASAAAMSVSSPAMSASLYTRHYLSAEELQETLEQIDDAELRRRVQELRHDVELLKEETGFLANNVEQLRTRGNVNANPAPSTTANTAAADPTSAMAESLTLQDDPLAATTSDPLATNANSAERRGEAGASAAAGGPRRGRSYYRRPLADLGGGPLFLSVEDKLGMLHKERDRLRQSKDKVEREAEHVRDVLTATVEEAVRRSKELRLERQQFMREVALEDVTSEGTNNNKNNTTNNTGAEGVHADDLVHYLRRRAATQANYLDKLRGQCEAAEQDILRAQQQLRRRRAAGEAFHAIDFAQLRIENQQLSERIEKKNAELVELKGMSTRTVQNLNTLMDALNEMSSEQARLRKEYKSRCEYLTRCSKEVIVAEKEAAAAERRHTSLKAQHEAVKVPKIEEYIAQRAELYELEKAMQNCLRKVEIAQGQVQVMRQQTQQLMRQRDAAIDYAASKKQRTAAMTTPRPTAAAATQSRSHPAVTTLPAIHVKPRAAPQEKAAAAASEASLGTEALQASVKSHTQHPVPAPRVSTAALSASQASAPETGVAQAASAPEPQAKPSEEATHETNDDTREATEDVVQEEKQE